MVRIVRMIGGSSEDVEGDFLEGDFLGVESVARKEATDDDMRV